MSSFFSKPKYSQWEGSYGRTGWGCLHVCRWFWGERVVFCWVVPWGNKKKKHSKKAQGILDHPISRYQEVWVYPIKNLGLFDLGGVRTHSCSRLVVCKSVTKTSSCAGVATWKMSWLTRDGPTPMARPWSFGVLVPGCRRNTVIWLLSCTSHCVEVSEIIMLCVRQRQASIKHCFPKFVG